MADIQISYKNVIKKADELEAVVNDLIKYKNENFEPVLSAQLTNGNWNGTSADEMRKKLEQLESQLNYTISDLSSAASELRRQANDWYNKEKLIQEMMKKGEEAIQTGKNFGGMVVEGIKTLI